MSANYGMTDVVLESVKKEMESAVAQHGPMHGGPQAYGVILEELDEFWDEVKRNPNKLTPEENNARLLNMRKELIQVAAMAARAIIDLELVFEAKS